MRMMAMFIGTLALAAAPCAQSAATVNDLGWMVGCWTGSRGATTFRESWTRADDNLLLGVSHTTKGGKVEAFEFLRVTTRQGRVVYLAQPGGQPETVFERTAATDPKQAVFTNPAHDFPKRVAYTATPDGLLAWIDAGVDGGKRIEYPMTRVPCDPR